MHKEKWLEANEILIKNIASCRSCIIFTFLSSFNNTIHAYTYTKRRCSTLYRITIYLHIFVGKCLKNIRIIMEFTLKSLEWQLDIERSFSSFEQVPVCVKISHSCSFLYTDILTQHSRKHLCFNFCCFLFKTNVQTHFHSCLD